MHLRLLGKDAETGIIGSLGGRIAAAAVLKPDVLIAASAFDKRHRELSDRAANVLQVVEAESHFPQLEEKLTTLTVDVARNRFFLADKYDPFARAKDDEQKVGATRAAHPAPLRATSPATTSRALIATVLSTIAHRHRPFDRSPVATFLRSLAAGYLHASEQVGGRGVGLGAAQEDE